jgi:hypothetical protein
MSKPLIEEIFGHALKSLADTGADATVMGKFALDFQTKIAPLIAGQQKTEVSLEHLIQSTVVRTLELSGQTGTLHTAQHTDVQNFNISRRSGEIEYERVTITVNGKRTNVTLEKRLHETISAIYGGVRKANKVVRKAANELGATQQWENPVTNKSALLSSYLQKQVLDQFDISQQAKQ